MPSPTIWAQLTEPSKKLQMLTLNSCNLTINAAENLLANIGPDHHELIYIDLQSNNLGDGIVKAFASVLDRYDLLEFIGIGNNSLKDLAALEELLDKVGKRDVGPDFVARYNERVRERNLIMEKNKKLRTLKKPEEHVFYLDTLVFNEETKGKVC